MCMPMCVCVGPGYVGYNNLFGESKLPFLCVIMFPLRVYIIFYVFFEALCTCVFDN